MSVRIRTIDDVVHVEWIGTPTEAEIRAYFPELAQSPALGRPYLMVYDLRLAELPSANRRRLLADLTNEYGVKLRTNCRGIAFVIDQVLVRGGLRAILWIQPMEVPHVIVETSEQADEWVARTRAAE